MTENRFPGAVLRRFPGSRQLPKAALVVLALIVGGCSTTVDSVGPKENALNVGKSAPVEKKESPAEQARYIDWLLAQGEKTLAAGESTDAYKLYAKILELQPKNPQAQLGAGESLLATGKLKKAAKMFSKAVKTPEVEAAALQGLGLSLARLGNHSAARGRLMAAVEKDPKLWRAWNALGESHDSTGNFEEAEKSYKHALKANPDAASIYNNLGVSLLVQRKYKEAEQEFRKAIEREPTLQQAKSNLRLALGWQGKYVEAMTGASKSEAPVILNNLGYIATKRGDYEFAEAYLVQAMQLSPAYYAKAAQNLEHLNQVRNAKRAAKSKDPAAKVAKQ